MKDPTRSRPLLAAALLATLAAWIPAQRQFDELSRRGLPADAEHAVVTALGDVDGDGDLDLVTGTNGQNRLYLNNGSGIFTDATRQLPTANGRTTTLVLGDIDGDRDLDLIVGNVGQNRLYLNNGTGTFTDATAGRLPGDNDHCLDLALDDVDGDRDLDIVVGNFLQQNRLYLNNGRGVFADATTGRLPIDQDATFAVVAGDVDGDGDLDLALGNNGLNRQDRLYLNNGAGTFADATATRMPTGIDFTYDLVLDDVDGDRDLDMILGNFGQNRLYLNNGRGTFTDATAARIPVAIRHTTSLATGDFDGDGDLDLVAGNEDQDQNHLYLNDGRGTFIDQTSPRLPVIMDETWALATGDTDGDGDLDLVVGNAGQRNRLHLNDGTATFTDATARRLPVALVGTTALAFGDVDGDGDLDLALGNGVRLFGEQNLLYLNDGRGSFTDATAARLPVAAESTTALAFGDVDGDGDLDLVVGNDGRSGGQNRLYRNDGKGTFTDATANRLPAVRFVTRALVLGDIDGDRDLDLVVGNSGQSRLYVNDGTGRFTDGTVSRLPIVNLDTSCLAIGDLDGDGDLDLVIGITRFLRGRQNLLYLNGGTGTFADLTATLMPAVSDDTHALALGDLDGDGDLDLVTGNSTQPDRLYLNDGSAKFIDSTATHLPASTGDPGSLALGDLDGDGDLDLVVGNSVKQQNRLLLNGGRGVFSDATNRLPMVTDPTDALALGDVDGDGDLDMAVGNAGLAINNLYINLVRQLDAPYVLHLGRRYQLDVYARYGASRPSDVATVFLSTATANIPLPPLGTVGIDPNRMVGLQPFAVPRPAGVGSFSVAVPNLPVLAGLTIYAQALLIQNPLPARLTNVVSDRTLR